MKVEKWYNINRNQLVAGTIGLLSKPAFISRTIRNNDRNHDGSPAEWSHSFILDVKEFEGQKRVTVIDSNFGKGVKPSFVSDIVKKADNLMFLIPGCPSHLTQKALFDCYDRAEKGIRYDLANGLKGLSNRGFGFNFKITQRNKHDICSDFTKEPYLTQKMGDFSLLDWVSPADYDRYANDSVKKLRYKI